MDKKLKEIIGLVIEDIDDYNEIQAKRDEEHINKVFDFKLFKRVMTQEIQNQKTKVEEE